MYLCVFLRKTVLGTHGPEGVAARSCAHAWARLVFAPGVGRVRGVVEPSRFVRACEFGLL